MMWPARSVVTMCGVLVTLCAGEAMALTGSEFRALPNVQRVYYMAGVLQGWEVVTLSAEALKEEEPVPNVVVVFANVIRCVSQEGMTQGQLLAIVDKYAAENPAQWHLPAAFLVWFAVREACPR